MFKSKILLRLKGVDMLACQQLANELRRVKQTPIRVAEDCAGFGPCMAALSAMGVACEGVWASEINRRLHTTLEGQGYSCILCDVNQRDFQPSSFTSTDAGGVQRAFGKIDDVDIFLAGVSCRPWSMHGSRRGWSHPEAKTLLSALKTVVCCEPKIWLLENVRGLQLGPWYPQVQDMLNSLRSYSWEVFPLNSRNYGLPQSRERLFFIGLRRDIFTNPLASLSSIRSCLENIEQLTRPCGPVVGFLQAKGLPVQKQVSAQAEPLCKACDLEVAAAQDEPRARPQHPCHCFACRRGHMQCHWRGRLRQTLSSAWFRKKHAAYLRAIKQASKNKPLKRFPDYFLVANSIGLAASRAVRSPRERTLLSLLSRITHLFADDVIVDLSQSVHRARFRLDGCAPTLTTSCSRLFLPNFGVCLDSLQCLSLQGIEQHMIRAASLSATERFRLAGNAISIPVLSSLLVAGLRELESVPK